MTEDPHTYTRDKNYCKCEGFTKNEENIEQLKYLEDIKENKKYYSSQIGIGERFINASFDNFTTPLSGQKEALEKSKEFIKKFILLKGKNNGLFFIGKPGTGKTHLCAAICRAILPHTYRHAWGRSPVPIKIINFTEFLNEIKETYNEQNKRTETSVFERYNNELLILDDIGKEYSRINLGSSWASEKLYAIINKRYEDQKATIVTTNLSIAELEKKIDPAIVSRLFEMCEGIKCTWKDYRKEGK